MENEILNEIKKLNTRIDKLEELHRLIHDLLIEYITLKSVKIPSPLNIEQQESTQTQSIQEQPLIKKNILKKKINLTNEDIKFKLNHDELEHTYYLEFNSKNYTNIEEKLSETSANNKVNVYKYLYVHFDDIRFKIINKLECNEFLNNLYNTTNNQKKFKDLTELLKNECIEIHKNYKDKDVFKKLLMELKKEYDNILQKVA
jgi:hypothetical protein